MWWKDLLWFEKADFWNLINEGTTSNSEIFTELKFKELFHLKSWSRQICWTEEFMLIGNSSVIVQPNFEQNLISWIYFIYMK